MKKISRRRFVAMAGGSLAGSALATPAESEVCTLPAASKDALDSNGGSARCASSWRIVPPDGADADIFLSPTALTMPRPRIALTGRALRLYSLRGSTSFRERTVTGLKAMIYPPLNLSDTSAAPPLGLSESGFFNLSFREQETGTLIQDIQDEFADPLYLNQKAYSANQMGPVYRDDASSSILLTQDAQWWPHCYVRTGIFNRRIANKLISFRAECRVFLSNTADEIYEEIDLHNRAEDPLSLTIIPDQPRPAERQQLEREPMFERDEGNVTLEVVSDIGPAGKEGWHVTLPAKGSRTVRFALRLKPRTEPATPAFCLSDLDDRIKKSVAAHIEELQWASSQLPRIYTANASLDEFYKRSILSVLFCRRVRENFCTSPFYDLGFGRGAAVAWDTSFSSRLIAQLDPQGLIRMVKSFLRSGGALNSTYLEWNGKSRGWYAQSPFALMEIVCDYLRFTGDTQALDTKIGTYTLLEYLKQAGKEFLTHYTRPNGLIDIGEGTGKMLEIRTFGYEHIVATINALAVDYFHQLGQWCRERSDEDGKSFDAAASRIELALNQLLWDENVGWYGNLYPDGTRTLVYSYHAFDMLRTSAVSLARKQRMAERIREGEFLAPYGMYSIALSDRDHWDMEDCDWGGGGQYVGQTLKIAGSLYACGEAERAWHLLSRAAQWVECFPYFPQTIYGDELKLQEHQVDWPLQISAGAGAQAIIGGVFGLEPQFNGSLRIQPHYNATLGKAKLTNYRFRGHVFDVHLTPQGFSVFKDGKLSTKEGNYE